MKRILTLIIFLSFTGIHAWSQDMVTEKQQESKDLKAQYKSFKEKAETYGEFKVFRESNLDEFWSVVNDSINSLKENISTEQSTIEGQKAEINQLVETAQQNEEKFQQNEFAATHISFIGIDFTKSTFIVLTTVLIGGLALMLFMGYFQYARSRQVAIKSAAECKKIEHELEDLRKKSLEKQIKLNRDLQTERNKVEELRNKSTISKRISA